MTPRSAVLQQMRRAFANAAGLWRWPPRGPASSRGSAVPPAAAAAAAPAFRSVRFASQYLYTSPLSDVELPRGNFAEMIMKKWKTYGTDIAMVDALTGRQYTYAAMYDAVAKTASGLKKLGFGRGDVLCLYSPNLPEYAIVFFAVLALGGTVTLANPLYTRGELSKVLRLSNSKIAVCIGLNLPIMTGAIQDLPDPSQVKKLFVIGKPESGVPSLGSLITDNGSHFDGICPVNCQDEVACLPFSSGTTGLPKGVQLTHYNLTSNLAQSEHPELFEAGQADSVCGLMPFFHIYGLMAAMCGGLHKGCRVVSYPKWDMEMFLQAAVKYRITIMSLVPPVIVALTKDPLTCSYDLTSIRGVTCGAAPLSEHQGAAFMEKFKSVKIFQQGFGMSEASPVITMNPRKNFKLGSSGVLLPHVSARVVDVSTGDDLKAESRGELLIKGPNVMRGYFKDAKSTAETLTPDGWLKTGDIGYFDKDGHLYIVDRLKELIKYKGFQVPPAELEGILLTHPAVRDAAVVGTPADDGDELPTAFIVLKPGEKASASDIDEYLTENLSTWLLYMDTISQADKFTQAVRVAPYKRLRGGVKFINDIPKNASGKILRRELKDKLK